LDFPLAIYTCFVVSPFGIVGAGSANLVSSAAASDDAPAAVLFRFEAPAEASDGPADAPDVPDVESLAAEEPMEESNPDGDAGHAPDADPDPAEPAAAAVVRRTPTQLDDAGEKLKLKPANKDHTQ
jgi:hypothetical protein